MHRPQSHTKTDRPDKETPQPVEVPEPIVEPTIEPPIPALDPVKPGRVGDLPGETPRVI